MSFQTGFYHVNAALVLSWRVFHVWNRRQIPIAQVLGVCNYLKLLSIYFDLLVEGVCHQLGFLGTDLYAVGCGGFVETLN